MYSINPLWVLDVDDQLPDLRWSVQGQFRERGILPQRGKDIFLENATATAVVDRATWFYRHDMRCNRIASSTAVLRQEIKVNKPRRPLPRAGLAKQLDAGH